MKKWLTFDLDGTIMQNPFVKYVFPEVQRNIIDKCSYEYNVIQELFNEHYLRVKNKRTVEAYDWDDIVEQHIRKQQLELRINIEELVEKHSTLPKVYLLEDESLSVLEYLKERGYSLAAVTNGFYKYQYPVMRELGLTRYFERIITPDQVGYGKPDHRILQSLTKDGEIIAHIGDRLDDDVQLANAFGIYSVFIYRQLPYHLLIIKADQRSKDVEIKKILESKWKRETQHQLNSLTESPIPDIIVSSLNELKDIW